MATKIQQVNEIYKHEFVAAVYAQISMIEGAINDIAERTGYHRETVRLTFKGKRQKSLPIVMEKAAECLEEYNAKHKANMEKIRNALAEIA